MDTFERIRRAFDRVVQGAGERLVPESTMDSVPGWDSLSYVQVVVAIEEEFEVSLTSLEAARMRSVAAIHAVLDEHGVGDGAPALTDAVDGTVARSHDPPPRDGAVDPMPALRGSRQATPVGRGRFVYSGALLDLLESLDRDFAAIADRHGATHLLCPTTVRAQSLLDAGYLGSFPHHAIFAGPVAPERLAALAAATSLDGVTVVAPGEVLAPTVCHHCMEALRGSRPGSAATFTASNPCHRHETGDCDDLSRTETFHMRELVRFGTPDAVAATLQSALDATLERFGALDLAFRVEQAADPFFAGALDDKAKVQQWLGLKREVMVRLDHSGEWIAAASVNDHRDSMVRAFEIDAPASGCIGWGLERTAYAIISRHGVDPGRWPVQPTPIARA